jgi:hypothetical protein
MGRQSNAPVVLVLPCGLRTFIISDVLLSEAIESQMSAHAEYLANICTHRIAGIVLDFGYLLPRSAKRPVSDGAFLRPATVDSQFKLVFSHQ